MASLNPISTGNTGRIEETKPSVVFCTLISSHTVTNMHYIISVRTYQSSIALNVGSIVETRPLNVPCTTTGGHSVSNSIYILFK